MAIGMTYNKRQEEQNRQQGKIGSAYPYNGMQGVSQNTANNLGNYQSGYKPSETVQQAQQQMNAINAQRPQGYNSKYAPALENILQQIQNPEKFKYEFNGDEMFKYYADLYSQYAKQGAMDTMGNAAALTGGYGNTSAQNAAAQAYQQAMLPLYDRGMELQQQAYGRYRDDLGDKQNVYNYLRDADTTDYGRYRDDMTQWMADRDYAAGRYDTERGLDLSQWQNDRDYWSNQAAQENAAMQSDRALARDYAVAILANGKMPTMDLLMAAGLSEPDARNLMADLMAGGSGGGSGGRKKIPEWSQEILGGIGAGLGDIGPGLVESANNAADRYYQNMMARQNAEGRALDYMEQQEENNQRRQQLGKNAVQSLVDNINAWGNIHAPQTEEKKKWLGLWK